MLRLEDCVSLFPIVELSSFVGTLNVKSFFLEPPSEATSSFVTCFSSSLAGAF